ncbi:MAG: OB-fold nucleic acid binding domain-containing protein, partial [Halobacteriota archaeon]
TEVNTFSRDDGSEGRVSNLVLGDESGWIRVTLWDERADDAGEFTAGDVASVEGGYTRTRDGAVEVHVGGRGAVEAIESDVEFEPQGTPIDEVEEGGTYDVAGVVTDAGEIRTFDRDDGSVGRVRNLRIRDASGELRVALWGEHADVDVMAGDEVVMTNVEVKEGWNDGLEGSANWNSAVVVRGTDPRYEEAEETGDGSPGLDGFG